MEEPDNVRDLQCRYILIKKIGKGSYGTVWKAYHKQRCHLVAIKVIENAFSADSDAQMVFREIGYLTGFRKHRNIIKLLAVHPAWNEKDVYLVFEHMDVDLKNYMDKGHILSDSQIEFITYQILSGLNYIHSGNVVHRDLKPANILLGPGCEARIADFGLARSLDNDYNETKSPLTKYVATRWYRAPELLFNEKKYSTSVDIWSLGCITCEMYNRTPLFPGTTTIHQLELILKSIPINLIDLNLDKGSISFQLTDNNKRNYYPELSQKLISLPKQAKSLVRLMLDPSSKRRITAKNALAHPFFSKYYPNSGPVMLKAMKLCLNDGQLFPAEEYKRVIYDTISTGDKRRKYGIIKRFQYDYNSGTTGV